VLKAKKMAGRWLGDGSKQQELIFDTYSIHIRYIFDCYSIKIEEQSNNCTCIIEPTPKVGRGKSLEKVKKKDAPEKL